MMIRRIALVLSAAACTAAIPAAAQQQAIGPSVEAGIGVHMGGGGAYYRRGGPALDAVVAFPLGRAAGGRLIGGVTAGVSGSMGGDMDCLLGEDGKCLRDFPAFVAVGAVAGVQRELRSGLGARALAGPAYFQAAEGPDVLALQGRLDVAQRLIFRTALVASVRGAVLPRYEGQTLSFAAFGLGIRIQ